MYFFFRGTVVYVLSSIRRSSLLPLYLFRGGRVYFLLLLLQEYLVGASPEMFVRCERTRDGIRVETCPISGTIERGANPLEDAQRIRSLLTNKKEESELTMCTDVDR